MALPDCRQPAYCLSWGWRPCLFSVVGSFCCFVPYFVFVWVYIFLLYFLSHHLQGRVHDNDLMRGHDNNSTTVGLGYVSSTRPCFLALRLIFQGICFFSLAPSPYIFPFFYFVCLFLLYFILFSFTV